MNKTFPIACLAASLLGGAALAPCATASVALAAAELPDAKQILDKTVEATWGSVAKDRDIKSMSMVGTFSMPAMGITGSLNVEQVAPNMMYTKVEIPGMMTQEIGIDGKTAWSVDTMGGPRVIEGDEAKSMTLQADMYSEVDYAKHYKDFKTVGEETLEGTDCYIVQMTSIANDTPEKRWIAKDSHLLMKMETTAVVQGGEIVSTTVMSDYKQIGPLMRPHTLTVSAQGQTQVITFESITLNQDIDASKFAPPASVKEVMKD